MRIIWVLVMLVPCFAQSDRTPYRGNTSSQKLNLEATWQSYFTQFGSHAFDPEFSLKGLGTDDNLFFQPEGEEVDDVVGQAEVNLDWLTRFSNNSYFQADALLAYDWYQDQDHLSDTHGDLSAKYIYLQKSWHGHFGYQIQSLRQNPSSEIDERPIVEAKGPYGFLNHSLGNRVDLSWDLSITHYEFEEGIQSLLLNRDSNRIDLTAKFRRQGRVEPLVQLIYEDIDFEHDQQTTFSQAFVGGRNEINGRLYLDLKVGYSQLQYDFPETNIDENDWMAETYLRYQWTRRFQMELGFVRQPVFSASVPGHFISNRALLGSKIKCSKQWEVNLALYSGVNEYPESFLDSTTHSEEDLNQIRAEIVWKPNASLKINLETEIYERTSDFAGRQADRKRIVLNLVFKPT